MKLAVSGYSIKVSYPLIAGFCALFFIDRSGASFFSCLAAALHEFGHFFILVKNNACSKNININLFNVSLKCSSFNLSINKDILVSVAGPLINLLFFVLSIAIFNFFPYNNISTFGFANFILFAFNLLPIDTLDGGRIYICCF